MMRDLAKDQFLSSSQNMFNSSLIYCSKEGIASINTQYTTYTRHRSNFCVKKSCSILDGLSRPSTHVLKANYCC